MDFLPRRAPNIMNTTTLMPESLAAIDEAPLTLSAIVNP
jgi:hypothetical protein